MKNILLLAEPRTGSHILMEYLRNAKYRIQEVYDDQEKKMFDNPLYNPINKIIPTVVHTHYPRLKAKKYYQIITYRKNTFDQIMSFCVATQHSEFLFEEYTVQSKQFSLSILDFDSTCCQFFDHKQHKLKLKKRKKQVIISYDEITSNPNILKDILNINYYQEHWENKKNPNQAVNLVINYQELLDYFLSKWNKKFNDINNDLLYKFCK